MTQITDALVATAVISEATSHGIYKGAMPTDDSGKIVTAQTLIDQAEAAHAAGMNGAPVMAVIAAATQGAPVAAAPPAAPAPPVAAPPPPPAAPQVTDFNVVIQDAAGQKYEVPNSQLAQYTANGYTVVEDIPAPPPVPAPVPTPAPVPVPPEGSGAPAPLPEAPVAPAAEPPAQAGAEPYEGFNKAKIPEIVAYVEKTLLEQGEAAAPLMAAIATYEKANKNRPRLLGKLAAIYERGVAVPGAAPEPAAAPPAPAPVAPEPADVNPAPPFTPPPAAPAPAPVAPAPVPIAEPQAAVATPVSAGVTPEFTGIAQPVADGATQKVNGVIAAEGLPIPGVVGEPPTLPEDFTILSDVDVRRYQSQFNACQARAHYLLAQAEGYSADAKIAADALTDEFIRGTQFEAKTTVTQMEAHASAQPAIQTARRTQHDWHEMARQYKALRDIYQSTCERLSREQTGRSDEHKTS